MFLNCLELLSYQITMFMFTEQGHTHHLIENGKQTRESKDCHLLKNSCSISKDYAYLTTQYNGFYRGI